MNKKIIGIVLGIFLLLLITITITGNLTLANRNEEYVIGLVAPLSETGSAVGIPMSEGMQMAVDEINENGGINNKKIKLIIEDGKFGGQDTSNAANFIINTKNPDILVTLFQPLSEVVSEIAKEKKIPLIYDAYVRSLLEDNNYLFKANFDSLQGCEELTRFAKDNNKYEKLAIVFPEIGFAQECFNGIKNIENNVEEFWFNVSEKDFRTILLKANQKKIDTIFVVGFDYHFIGIFNEINKYNYPIKIMAATTSEALPTNILKTASSESLSGTLTIDFIDLDIQDSEFSKKYKLYANRNNLELVDFAYAAEGYDHAMIISKAMESCMPKNTSCLIDALENVSDHITVNGNKGFKDRVLQNTNKIYEYMNGEWVLQN
jgi:branched-chain amino acid transport system substrate-binding protein